MANGEFTPHFEPQVELETGRIIGFEMLMRWQSTTLGQVPPERFIPMAEEAGLISNLSLQVVREAMLVARHWSSDIMLSINLSPLQLRDPWFSQKLTKLLVETGFPAPQLEVEVTETALIDDKPLVTSIINSLKNQGVRLTLDSFGTGYASLSHLRSLPFDRIKIDRSFIAAMAKSADARAIVMAVLRLGESLATSIVAKGVEDEATAKDLIALGCKQAQGWYFGRAASPKDLMAMLSARGLLRRDGDLPLPPAPNSPAKDGDLLRHAI
jgi:EAL domain-containing protein (putative c-di-GMP-specific phosphodiesterase class I)